MQVNSISGNNIYNSNNNKCKSSPSFQAKVGPGLEVLVKNVPGYDDFMKMFSKWGDSNSVVDIYNANINGKTKYMLRLSNNVLDGTNVGFKRDEPVFMKKDLIKRFFDLSQKDLWWAEGNLFKEVKKVAFDGGKPYMERLLSIINSNKKDGIVFDYETAKRFNDI